MSDDIRGLIWNIQRFNIHDGSGIRTLIFLKGCPLRCIWCSNPEGQQMKPEVMKDELIGNYMTVEEVIRITRKDEPFYRNSGGGITLTGGEPLLQAEFAAELLKAAKVVFLDTSIETCGYVRWEQFEKVIPYTDTFLFDIKNTDPAAHLRQTGFSNELILENLAKLAAVRETDLIFRMPIIPGENDDRENLMAVAALAIKLNIKRWDIMPYHRYGEHKYEELGRHYRFSRLQVPSDSRMEEIISEIKPVFPRIVINH